MKLHTKRGIYISSAIRAAALPLSCLGAAALLLLPSLGKAETWAFDSSFQRTPLLESSESPTGVLALQSGKVLMYSINGSRVSGANGQRIGALIRVDGTTGAVDPTWKPDAALFGILTAAAEAPNGKIYYSAQQAGEVAGSNRDSAIHRVFRLNTDGSRDLTFNSPVFGIGARYMTVQPDGKIIVAIGGLNGFGVIRPGSIVQTVRLNTDGTIDSTFQSPNFQSTSTSPPVTVSNYRDSGIFGDPVVDPVSGKIYFCGSFRFVNGQTRRGIVRCNPDGSLDTTFVPSAVTSANGRAMVVQAGGKLVLGGTNLRTSAGGTTNYALLRFNGDGTVDSTFTLVPAVQNSLADHTRHVRALPDGKLITTASVGVVRYLPDGAVDSSFPKVALTSPHADVSNGSIGGYRLSIHPQSGAIYLQNPNPRYANLNGAPVRGPVTKISANGVIDQQFVAPILQSENFGPDVQTGPTGAVYVSGFYTDFGNTADAAVVRLNDNGTRDGSYALDSLPFPDKQAASFALLPDGSAYVMYASGSFNGGLLFSNLVRLTPSGAIDTSFRPAQELQDVFNFNAFDGRENFRSSTPPIAPSTGGAVLLFSFADPQLTVDLNGELGITRINPDGTEDPSVPPLGFATGEVIRDGNGITGGSTAYLYRLRATADGGVLVLASVAPFPSSTAGAYNYQVIKVRADGTRDLSFGSIAVTSTLPAFVNFPFLYDPVTDSGVQPVNGFHQAPDQPVTGAVVMPDGSVILTGSYRLTGGDGTTYSLAKFTPAGALDTSFALPNPAAENTAPGREAVVSNVRVAPDGKLWVSGRFDRFGGSPAPGVARLNPDGSLDSSFALADVAFRDWTDDRTDVVFTNTNHVYLVGTFRRPSEQVPFAVTRLVGPPIITSPLAASGTRELQFTYQFLAVGADSLVVSNLPPGLSFDPFLETIVGTPTQSGTYTVGLSAANEVGTTLRTLTLTVQDPPSAGPLIASSTAATGRTGERFSFQVFSSGGSSSARITAVNLPPGLALDSVTGVISGVPATEGSFAVELTVTDGNFVTVSVVQLTVTADLTLPVITSASEAALAPGQPFQYQIVAPTSTPDDPVIYTLIGDLPDGLSFDAATGTISGTPTVQRRYEGKGKPLSGGVITNVQLFATNSKGTTTKPLPFFLKPTGAVNIATRLAIGTDQNVLIGGFIITGNAPKKLIIRAVAPSLGFAGTLQDPVMELRDGAGELLKTNDDWRSFQEQEIFESGVAPRDDRESAMIAILNPGAYTAVIGGKDNSTGIGVVEVYDLGTASLDTGSAAKLANISTRGFVQAGDDVMIGGFIIDGAPSRLIVRAVGPSLGAAGVEGALQDTTLDFIDGNGTSIAFNDDWRTGGQEQQIIETTVQPSDDRESAVVATLNAGAYTAVVRGKNGTTGVGLVEVYVLQ